VSALPLFDHVADALEQGTLLSRLEARGALRVTLQKLGVDPKELPPGSLAVLLEEALPRDLEERGIPGARELCRRILAELQGVGTPPASAAAPAPSLFDWMASALEARTTLSRIEARGTVRHILRDAGLTPEHVTRGQLLIVLAALAPRHLRAAAIPDPEGVCERIRVDLRSAVIDESSTAEAPDEIFDRLGRR
jgi:hypothetical protein